MIQGIHRGRYGILTILGVLALLSCATNAYSQTALSRKLSTGGTLTYDQQVTTGTCWYQGGPTGYTEYRYYNFAYQDQWGLNYTLQGFNSSPVMTVYFDSPGGSNCPSPGGGRP